MGWIERYLELAQHTEPPTDFHVWCAIAGLGHVLGRKVWLNQYAYRIYPAQMMVLLCSESAVARKTTAMRMVGEFIEKLPLESWNIIPQRVTGATLLDALNRVDEHDEPLDAVGLIFAEELGTFFSREHARQDLPTLVTELNDAKEGQWKAPTRTYGAVTLWNPCLGMVAGVTPTGLAHEVPAQVRRTGFLGRCVTVLAEGAGEPQDLTEPPPGYDALRAWLYKDLYRIAWLPGPGNSGAFTWSDDAKAWYRTWYKEHFAIVQAMGGHQAETGWMGRKHVHLLRTAMILTCAARNALVFELDMLEKARRLVDRVQKGLPSALMETGPAAETGARKDRLLAKFHDLTKKNGQWIQRRRLYQYTHRMYFDYQEMTKDLFDLEQMGRVERQHDTDGKHEIWRLVHTKGTMLKGVK